MTLQAFRKGMHAYLSKHAYGNTFTEDLWDALSEASGKDVADIMSSWTKQMGFPVLKVVQLLVGYYYFIYIFIYLSIYFLPM